MRALLRGLVVVLGLLIPSFALAGPAGAVEVTNFDVHIRIERGPDVPPLPGGTGSVVFVVTNDGPDAVESSTPFALDFGVLLPSVGGAEVARITWTCDAPAATVCPNQYRPVTAAEGNDDADLSGVIPPGSDIRLTVRFDVPDDAIKGFVALGRIRYEPGTRDLDPFNDAAPFLVQPYEPRADLGVEIDNGRDAFVPGEPTTYAIVVTNHGPDDLVPARARLQAPATPADATWRCEPGPGALCNPSGTGVIDEQAVIPVGGHVTYLVTFVPPGIPPQNQDYFYGAGVDPTIDTARFPMEFPDGSVTDVDVSFTAHDFFPGNDRAIDYDFVPAQAGQVDTGISIDNGVEFVGASQDVVYTFVVTNDGPETATGSLGLILAPMEIGSIAFTCQAAGGAACAASGTAHLVDPNNPQPGALQVISDAPTLPPGSSATYRVTATIEGNRFPQTTINASFVPDGAALGGDRTEDFAIDTDPIVPGTDLAVTIDDGVETVVPGATVTYSMAVANDGPDDAGYVLIDGVLPDGLENVSWRCTATASATCTPSGVGDVVQRGVSIPAGGSLTYTITGTVAADAIGSITASASASVPPIFPPEYPGTLDPDGADNAATDTDVIPTPDVGVTVEAPIGALPGSTIPIAVTVTNGGTGPAPDVTMSLPIPAGTTYVSAQQRSGPVATLTTPSVGGTGTVGAGLATLAAGASATFDVVVAVGPAVPVGTQIDATATVATTAPEIDGLPNEATARTLVVAPVTATISPTRLRVDEGQVASLTVRFSPATAIPTTLTWTAVDGIDGVKFSARAGQTPIADFVGGPRTVMVPPGTSTLTIAVPVSADGIREADESFRVQLVDSTVPFVTIGSPSTSTVTIPAHLATPPPPPVFPPVILP